MIRLTGVMEPQGDGDPAVGLAIFVVVMGLGTAAVVAVWLCLARLMVMASAS